MSDRPASKETMSQPVTSVTQSAELYSQARSLFVFSTEKRDELSAALSRQGFLVASSRRAQGLSGRLAGSDQTLVLIDLRLMDAETRRLLERLKNSPLGYRHKYIGLLSGMAAHADEHLLRGLDWVGWLVDGFSDDQLLAIISHCALTLDHSARALGQQLSWRWDGHTLHLSPALKKLFGKGRVQRLPVFKLLDDIGQQRFWLTLQALGRHGTHRAFVHELSGQRVIHQIQRMGETLAGHVHWLEGAEATDRRVNAKRPMDGELRRAIRENGIVIFFQPQFDTAHHRLIGAEALTRWDHSQLGLIGAETLFSMADRLGLGQELSRNVIAQALHSAANWPAALADLKLSVNVTAAELASEDFAQWMNETIEKSGFPHHRLVLEITEQALIGNLGAVSSVLNSLTSRGAAVAIDDFGSGYANFSYIKALPVDTLKLDRSLVEMLEFAHKDRIIVGSIISMARELGFEVLAEGVETDGQLAILSDLGAAAVQGYLFGEPMPGDDFEAFAMRSN